MTDRSLRIAAKALLVLVLDKAKREGFYSEEFANLDNYILIKNPAPAATGAGQEAEQMVTIPSSL